MFKPLLRFLGILKNTTDLEMFEPIYGLPKRSLNEWLSRNPQLKKQYERELMERMQRELAASRVHARDRGPARIWKKLIHAARPFRLLARRHLSIVFGSNIMMPTNTIR